MTADRDAQLKAAQMARQQGRNDDALARLAHLQTLYPRFSRLYQEQGHCHVGLGDTASAIAALQEAVRLNPTLPASWDMLEQLYRLTGVPAQAAAAAQTLAQLRSLPPQVVVANSLYADGDLKEAEDVIRDYLDCDADNIGAARMLARILNDDGRLDEAEALLEEVLARAPDYHAARLDYALVLLQSQKPLPARQQAEHLLAHNPDHRDYLKQYAAACVALGDYEPVIALYDRLLSPGGPALPAAEIADLRYWRAHALKITGRYDEALADYHAALAAKLDYGVAWFGLANLKTYRFSDADIMRMRAALQKHDLQDMDRIYLSFALGKALEDRRAYELSWHSYAQGNALRKRTSTYSPEVAEACATRLQQSFTVDFFARRQGWGLAAPSPVPIFVVGLPRSGSTLIEQILASHSSVEGTQELTEIERYAAELFGRDPACHLPVDLAAARRMTPEAAQRLAQRYLDDTHTYRREGRAMFVDKMPNNFWHIGLIHLLMPNAIIVDVRREPMASGFSNFKQLFGGSNQMFSYDLVDIGRHYRTYLDVMAHWDRVLPGRVMHIQYEDLVADLDRQVRRLLAHCGLPYEAGCLAYHATQRSVRTPSSEQVRRPIDPQGTVQWQNYAPWMSPLHDTLGDALTRYRV
ncbi:tetratricopeptide repeat family protein [Asticcacaulis biprosthecium C19]|uniref:Tetratricopeptide repeat family protein n=1 Tax=Asticcacaulis biprosthecium C19 TaxID=715226 RepID=F4QSR5_9CAUL|nr:sulfotransferase [Asticcacaulis biprosthecium]EGF89785.1 tetratricopeptide repeat family protein [Asticcacaulis biprosthecium C19]